MKFTKMQGCGNDYVYVNCFEEKIESPEELSIKISDFAFLKCSSAFNLEIICKFTHIFWIKMCIFAFSLKKIK